MYDPFWLGARQVHHTILWATAQLLCPAIHLHKRCTKTYGQKENLNAHLFTFGKSFKSPQTFYSMTDDVEFLFNEQLIAAVIRLIRSSKNKLLLISPGIAIDARVQDALQEKKDLHNFELRVLFGKKEDNILPDPTKVGLDFFKNFPNVEIRHDDRLQVNFYLNDYEYILGSLNLCDLSQNKNIQAGIRSEYASKGLMGKALDLTTGIIGQGLDKVKQDVIGLEKGASPIEKFTAIFEASVLQFKTTPLLSDRGGLKGIMGAKKLNGFTVVVDELIQLPTEMEAAAEAPVETVKQSPVEEQQPIYTPMPGAATNCVSAAQLSRSLGVQVAEIISLMQEKGFIQNNVITALGAAKGLIIKNDMGNEYIAYPNDMEELNELWR